jgi:hypothetical protein
LAARARHRRTIVKINAGATRGQRYSLHPCHPSLPDPSTIAATCSAERRVREFVPFKKAWRAPQPATPDRWRDHESLPDTAGMPIEFLHGEPAMPRQRALSESSGLGDAIVGA